MRRSKYAQAPGQLRECRIHTSSGKQSGWFLGTHQTEDRLWSYVLEVEHQGDWTYRTKGSSLLIQELFSECYPQMDRLIEFFIATSSRKADLRRLVRAIRSTRESDRLIAAHDLSNCLMKNCFVFGIVGDFRPSIRRSIYSNGNTG